MNTQPIKYYEAGYEGGSSAPTPKMSVEEYWHTNKELIISNYVLSKEKFLAFASQFAASANSDESTPTSAPVKEIENDIIDFAIFCGSGFWFNNGDSDLWESFNEGEEFEVNGVMQFRFTTKELYQVFLNTVKKNHYERGKTIHGHNNR